MPPSYCKMVSRHTMSFLCLLFLALVCNQDLSSSAHAADAEAEPPFPQLIGYGRNTIKIVSELVGERLGRQTSEEYHDLDLDKSAYYTTTVVAGSQTAMSMSAGNLYQVRYISAMDNLAYSYRPFQCKVSKITDLARSLFDEEQNWNYDFQASWRNREHRYFGVYGLWMYANNAPRTFSRAQIVYSAAKDVYRESLLWSVRDEDNKMTINLYYIQHDEQNKKNAEHSMVEGPALEMIEVELDDPESIQKKRKILSINILSIEYALPDQVHTDFFDPPVGFGCFSRLVAEGDAQLVESRRRDAQKWKDWTAHSLHVELEVTATKHNLQQSPTGATKEETISETYNVEVAQSRVQALLEQDFIEMIRLRNTAGDKKVVINHMLRVLYAIDMRTGTCDMSHINPPPEDQSGDPSGAQKKEEAARTDELYETVSLKFKNNGLALDIGVQIFKSPEDLHFIKKTFGTTEMHYFEGSGIPFLKNLEDPASNGGIARKLRMIYTYAKHGDQLDLHSLTIWVLNEHETRILESYLVNVLDSRTLRPGWPDEAKMFDVSEECYLENEHMVQNRDYAWLELTYPAQSHALNVFASNEQELKQNFYDKIVADFSRVPRLEVLFEEDSFIMRMLKLDVPPTELVYDKLKNQVLKPATELGDLSYMAPDLAHCGHYCRMHLCTVMSFCAGLNSCILSSRPLTVSNSTGPGHPETVFMFSDNNSCDTYKIPPIIERNQVLKQNRLQGSIARLQQQNYGLTSLPKLPDEIALPLSETGLSQADHMAAVKEYESTLEKALESDNRLPELTISVILAERYFVFVPSKFELENDPLREFNIYEDTDDDQLETDSGGDQNLPRFHQGLPGSRYNLAAQAAVSEETRDQLAFRAFSGLTYDQCAIACADSRCGSFSFCNHQGGDCVLSNINSTGRARTLGLVQDDPQCFIAQRDFLRNFDKFKSTFRPQVYAKTADAGDASECALNCVSETSFKCLSFEFCEKTLTANAPPALGQCYYQTERHLPAGEQLFNSKAKKSPAKPQNASESRCDHYSRSYLADFVRLESRKLAEPLVEQLKTSSFNGLSVFSCAQKCATELLDCTGFQFCHLQDATTSQQARECTTIESKVTPQVLKEAGFKDDTQTLVDEQAGGRILQAGKYLQFDEHCQLFTLSKNTAESQLRDLAFGSLVKTRKEKEAEERAKAEAKEAGSGLTFVGGFLLYVLMAALAAGVGFGVVMLKDNNAYVQQRVDRLRILLGV